MKKKMKIFKLLFLSVFLVFFSCEKDLYDEHIHHEQKMREISIERFKEETGLVNFETSVKVNPNLNNSNLRNTDGSYELSDFQIDTTTIRRIELIKKLRILFKLSLLNPLVINFLI